MLRALTLEQPILFSKLKCSMIVIFLASKFVLHLKFTLIVSILSPADVSGILVTGFTEGTTPTDLYEDSMVTPSGPTTNMNIVVDMSITLCLAIFGYGMVFPSFFDLLYLKIMSIYFMILFLESALN